MRQPGEEDLPVVAEPDKYYYDRLLRILVEQGFGNYAECAAANIVDAAIFIYAANDPARKAGDWLRS